MRIRRKANRSGDFFLSGAAAQETSDGTPSCRSRLGVPSVRRASQAGPVDRLEREDEARETLEAAFDLPPPDSWDLWSQLLPTASALRE